MFNQQINFLTLNIKGGGINNDSKINLLDNLIKNNNIDITILTEVRLFNHLSINCFKIEDFNTKAGILILINNNIFKINKYKNLINGRATIFSLETPNNQLLEVLAIYAPSKNNSKKEFWNNLEKLNLKFDILIGDLNIGENEPNYFLEFSSQHNLLDSAKLLHKEYLHTLNHYNKKSYRPDRIYINVDSKITNYNLYTKPFILSDHNALIFSINPQKFVFNKILNKIPKSKIEIVTLFFDPNYVQIPQNVSLENWETYKLNLMKYLKNVCRFTSNEKINDEDLFKIQMINIFNIKKFDIEDIPKRKMIITLNQRFNQRNIEFYWDENNNQFYNSQQIINGFENYYKNIFKKKKAAKKKSMIS